MVKVRVAMDEDKAVKMIIFEDILNTWSYKMFVAITLPVIF